MAQSSLIQIRVDEELKKQAEDLFNDIGLDTPSAIRLFLKQSVINNSIPFPLARAEGFYNPVNQSILKKAVKDLNAGKGVKHELLED